MADFSHLKALEVTSDKTSEYVFHQITVNGLTPTLIVAPATEANKPYFNALLKRSGKAAKALRSGGTLSAGMIAEGRDEDRELYPRFIIRGWEDMTDKDGSGVKFSSKEAANFLQELPDHVFDGLRAHCVDTTNFSELLDIQVSSKN